MIKDGNLEKITSRKEFRGGLIEGTVGPICVPYNIGNIKQDNDDTAPIQRKTGRIIGGMLGGLGLITQGGLYSVAAYKGYPEALAIPAGASLINYLKGTKELGFVHNFRVLYKSLTDPQSLL